MGWCVVHPFNTVCVRMNLATASGSPKGNLSFVKYLSSTVKEAGFMSLYAGLSAGLLRQTCYATSRFGLFEVFRDEMAKYRPTDIWSRLSTGTTAIDMSLMQILFSNAEKYDIRFQTYLIYDKTIDAQTVIGHVAMRI